MEPLQRGASLFPAAAMRFDLGVILTLGKFGPQLAFTGLQAPKLTGPFGNIVDRVVTNKWLRNFIDLECFVLSGMTAKDTLCAEMAFMFMERNKPDSTIDYPMGGSEAIVGALVRAIEKFGGKVLLRAHVEEIVVQGGQAVGVRLHSKKQELIKAKHAVVSNASTWDTQKLLPDRIGHESWRQSCRNTPQTESFMHLHLGINADGLDPDLQCHHLIVNDWDQLTAPQNVCIASIPTVFDKSLAPPGKAVVHAYTAGNEPYSFWAGMKTNSQEYKDLKEERSECGRHQRDLYQIFVSERSQSWWVHPLLMSAFYAETKEHMDLQQALQTVHFLGQRLRFKTCMFVAIPANRESAFLPRLQVE
eukprot:TRINITY_DN31773_c0_g1_i1.p1 TRINITY_DN31773_c0_g1~~TRINITY_DN31773_c0_g1_i1.p1  ORF type:complete len:402 (-),score=35.16 TRINITY_DN31773_c0_g1_i1:362-1444(-)